MLGLQTGTPSAETAADDITVRLGQEESWSGGGGDHHPRMVTPMIRSPPEAELVWQASALRQASYMSLS